MDADMQGEVYNRFALGLHHCSTGIAGGFHEGHRDNHDMLLLMMMMMMMMMMIMMIFIVIIKIIMMIMIVIMIVIMMTTVIMSRSLDFRCGQT